MAKPLCAEQRQEEHPHGWWVRVEREQAKFHQLFSDGKYGGIEDAFIESINFRHEVISSFPLEMRKRTVKKNGLAKNPDDRIARCIAKGKNQPYIHWKAVWYDEDYKLKKREFSVLKFGEDGAKELALEQATQNIVDTVYKKHQEVSLVTNIVSVNVKNILSVCTACSLGQC